MSDSRRDFIKKAGLLAGIAGIAPGLAAGFTPSESKIYKELTELQLHPDTDDFWAWVRSQYSTSPTIINLNNGGVSPASIPVQEAFKRITQNANEGPSYFLWRIMEEGRINAKKKLAALLGSSENEICINRNATEALDTIIFGIKLQKGDEVVLSKYDYPRMMNAWKYREKNEGIVLKWVDFDFPEEDKEKLIQKYTSLFTTKTKVVHITHLINWVGQVIPAAEIGEVAQKKGIRVVLDAAHSFAHLEFKINDLNCDYMGTSLHKWLCAPLGTGMMYIREDMIETIPPIFVGEPNLEKKMIKFEDLGTRNTPAELSVAHAVDFHTLIGSKRKQDRLFYLKNYWTEKVKSHPKIKISTPSSQELSGAIGLVSIEGKEGFAVESALFQNYRIHSVSIKYEKLNGVRITPNVYTSTEELDWLVEGLLKIANQ